MSLPRGSGTSIHRTKKLLVGSTNVGSDISYYHKQIE